MPALLIAVGRHHPEKRLRTIIQAVSRAQSSRKIGLYIAGDGFLRASVERWALNARNVYVAGQINDPDQLATMMASADALIHGSAAETFGLVLAEALVFRHAAGRARRGRQRHLRRARLCARPIAPAMRRTARARSCGCWPATARRQSRAALAAADARVFNVEQHFEKLFEIYERIVAERSTR